MPLGAAQGESLARDEKNETRRLALIARSTGAAFLERDVEPAKVEAFLDRHD